MMSTCVILLNPIEEPRERTLFRVAELAERRDVPVLLCGAFARDVVFWHMHGIDVRRETMDIDISVQIPNWDTFEGLGEDLKQNGLVIPMTSIRRNSWTDIRGRS